MEEYDDESYANTERLDFIKRQEAKGMVINYPEANELLIDIDTTDQYNTFLQQLEILERNIVGLDRELIKCWASKSGLPACHISVRLPFDLVTPAMRIAFQAALGSDPMRELLSLVRLKNGDDFPTILVEKEGWKK